jgi:hypothetical protein
MEREENDRTMNTPRGASGTLSADNSGHTEAPDSRVLLHRILAAVEKDHGRGRIELAVAIILSVTTLATTWCGYQAKLWGNVQSTKQAEADTSERKSAEDSILGLQLRTFDVLEVREYWSAMRQKDTETSDAVFVRMRPSLRKAIEASLAAGVLHNPDEPGPLQRPEYVLTQEQDAKRLREEAGKARTQAQAAGQASGAYVLLTLDVRLGALLRRHHRHPHGAARAHRAGVCCAGGVHRHGGVSRRVAGVQGVGGRAARSEEPSTSNAAAPRKMKRTVQPRWSARIPTPAEELPRCAMALSCVREQFSRPL